MSDDEQEEILVRTIDHPGIEPAEALARLRSYTPERPSFILESLTKDGEAGRYSIVGYRTRRSESLPPAADMNGELGNIEQKPAAETLAQGLAVASIGYVSSDAVSFTRGVRLYTDAGPSGVFAVGGAVMVYDHAENKVHVAGRAKGKAAERLVWELEHAPAPAPVSVEAAPLAKGHHRRLGDKPLRARAGRVQSLLDEDVSALVLADEFTAPLLGVDPFDVYRALRQLANGHSHGFFIDFGHVPNSSWTRIVGVSKTPLHLRRRGETASGWESLAAKLPHAQMYGDPALMAARVLRDIENESRTFWGDAVGYVCPGGESAWVLSETCAILEGEGFGCTVGARVDAQTDVASIGSMLEAAAELPLRALGAAQASAGK